MNNHHRPGLKIIQLAVCNTATESTRLTEHACGAAEKVESGWSAVSSDCIQLK